MGFLPDWLTGFDSTNAEAAAAADAKLQELNAANPAYQTAENQAILEKQRASELTDVGGSYDPASERGAIDKAFTDKLDAQAQGIFGRLFEGIRKVVAAILKSFPWWLWLVLAVLVFGWLGGFTWIRGILAKKAK